MTPLAKGLIVGATQLLLVAGMGAKFLSDRARYPRLWVETAPYDPTLPIRGRYVNIALVVGAEPGKADGGAGRVVEIYRARLEARGDGLVAVRDDVEGRHWVRKARCDGRDCWQLAEALAYFIPEHALDPSRPPPGAALWAEVTLPPTGAPRPIRLGLRRGEAIEPISP